MNRAVVSWILIGLVGVVSLVVLIPHLQKGKEPSWGQLPPPSLLAETFGVQPAAVGKAVPLDLVPVAFWSGAVEDLANKEVTVVAFDGPGTLVPGKGVGVRWLGRPGLFALASNGRIGVMGAWRSGSGWVATVVWCPEADAAGVAVRLGGLVTVAGPPLDPVST